MFHAVVIEESLTDKSVLDGFKIVNTKRTANWKLDILEINNVEYALNLIQSAMRSDEEYYWHIYDDGKTLIIVFREKVFHLDPNDQDSWKEAQEYGAKILNIIPEQLEFYPIQFSDEPKWLATAE